MQLVIHDQRISLQPRFLNMCLFSLKVLTVHVIAKTLYEISRLDS